jgi:ABC-type glycerol-3-phosphate transport system substrate-binding protein
MTAIPKFRRAFVATLATAGAALLATLLAAPAQAAPPVVEIIAFAHPPVQSSLKPLREWLATQGGHLKVVETDIETPAGEKRLQAVGVKGHVPVVVLIDGQYRHKRADGSTVELLSFPAGPSAPAGTKGGWTLDDVKAAIPDAPAR